MKTFHFTTTRGHSIKLEWDAGEFSIGGKCDTEGERDEVRFWLLHEVFPEITRNIPRGLLLAMASAGFIITMDSALANEQPWEEGAEVSLKD